MLVLMILLACPSAPPVPETPRWNPNVAYPAEVGGALMKRAISAMLHDPDPKIRRSAAETLSSCRNPEVVPPLLQAFQDQDAEVRKEAISHFNQYPDLRAIEPLIKLLKDPDASVRNEALHIIYNNKDPRIVPPMVDVLRNSKETVDNRYQAAWGLNFTEDRRAVDPFLAVLRDRSAPSLVRFEVTVGLQRIGEGRAVEPLIAALRDSSEPVVVRIGTAQALAKFGDRRATDLMIQIAKSDGPRDLRFWGAIGAAELTQGTINDLHCITPIIDCYRALDGVEYDLAAKGNALATIVEHAKNQTIRWAAARMLFGIAPDGCFKPRLSDDEKETAAERDTEAQLDLGMQALRERKLHDARSCFEKSEKHLARIASRERRIAFQSQAICGMAAIAETEPRWSKMTAAEMAAEQEGVDALRDKATIYFRGDPYVMHDARHSVPPSVPVGADSLVEGLIAVGFHTQGRFREADMKYLEKMPGLRMLCLEQADITRRGLMHINGLKNLEYLGLPSSITNADLPKLLDFQRLSVLHLQGKGITDEGLKHVARLRGLTRLSLSGTAITDAGLKDLKSLRQLRELSLGWTQVSDAGLEQLAAMAQLQELRVNDTGVTSQGLEKLQKALPNCKIVDRWPMYVGRHTI